MYEVSHSFAELLRRTHQEKWPLGSPWSARQQRHWLFQANPNQWDLSANLGRWPIGGDETWTVTRYREQMSPGDDVVLWQAGKHSGIYGFARFESPRSRPRSLTSGPATPPTLSGRCRCSSPAPWIIPSRARRCWAIPCCPTWPSSGNPTPRTSRSPRRSGRVSWSWPRTGPPEPPLEDDSRPARAKPAPRATRGPPRVRASPTRQATADLLRAAGYRQDVRRQEARRVRREGPCSRHQDPVPRRVFLRTSWRAIGPRRPPTAS